jgi:hypothetical protein
MEEASLKSLVITTAVVAATVALAPPASAEM